MASPSFAWTSGLCPGIGFDLPKSVPEGMRFPNALLLAGGIGISRILFLLAFTDREQAFRYKKRRLFKGISLGLGHNVSRMCSGGVEKGYLNGVE